MKKNRVLCRPTGAPRRPRGGLAERRENGIRWTITKGEL